MSLVAGTDDGGVVEELRLGVSSGTEGIEDDECSDEACVEACEEEGAMEAGGDGGGGDVERAGGGGRMMRGPRSAASGGRGGKMISAGST